jgi:hypothetical protein
MKIKFPVLKMYKDKSFIVRFDGENSGTVIRAEHDSGRWVNEYSNLWISCYDTNIWESYTGIRTKEDLLNLVKSYNNIPSDISDNMYHDLVTFFENNTVIPKGVNRHPDADILHELVEGADLVETTIRFLDFDGGIDKTNKDIKDVRDIFPYSYNIKQQKPTYEWQWSYQEPKDCTFDMSGYMTDDEFCESGLNHPKFNSQREERTKRIRKV